nr:integrase, catalytic region, zinc finger, CCHC-type, peptidase aspartic, catalytic [Tanacetum cinerariifolium]
MFQQGEDLIEFINKVMAFLSSVESRFPPSNNLLRTSSNPRNQATIQDAGQPRVVKCYNCEGEGHMERQCTQPKRPRNVAWFKEKLVLAKAREVGQILDEEQLAFIADPGISEAPVAQQTISQNLALQTKDLDAYDSDCDDLSSFKSILLANLLSCDPEVLSEDTNSSARNDLLVLSLVKQMTDHVAHLDKKISQKWENVINIAVSKPNVTIAPGMFKLDIEPISPRLMNNRNAHEVYIEKTIEYINTLRRFVKRARTQNPSEPLLESACMFTKRVQELLVYVSQTCPNSPKPRVKPTTSASASNPSGNIKNNKITQPSSSNQKNKVEDHSRKVKSSLNKTNSIFESVCNALVKRFIRNVVTPTSRILVYSRRPKATRSVGSSSKVKIVESKTSNSKEPKQSWGSTVSDVPSSSLNDCRFRNDHIAKIMGYEDYQMGNVTISRVYYVEGLGLKDKVLVVASKIVSFILRLYKFSYQTRSSPRSSKTKVLENHLYSACALGKSKTHFHKPKAEDSIQEKLYLLHMDLYGPMRVQSINGRKYILVIVDDFSRFTWVKFLRSNDEVPEFVIKFLKMIQVCLNATIRNIRTDNGTEFVNQTLKTYYEEVGISHQTSLLALHNRMALSKDRTADIRIFIGYAPTKKAFRIYNKRTRMIIETIHVDFDKLTAIASKQFSSGLGPKLLTPGTISSGHVPNIPSSTPYVPPTKND